MKLQEKYNLLMEKVADKEVAPGLIMEKGEILIERRYVDINVVEYSIWNTENDTIETTEFIHSFGKIIGSPITIGRAMQVVVDNDVESGFDEIIGSRPFDRYHEPIEPTEDFEPVIDFLLTVC